MVERFLITTALEATWCYDEPVLFVGEWCRRYSLRENWSRMDAEVLPYHWDDRAKLHADYQYLREVYEVILKDLGHKLNQIHSVQHSHRYWRILVGPWLGHFVQMLYDRWCSIQQAVSSHAISKTIILPDPDLVTVPNDMVEFQKFFLGDAWNHRIYSMILEQFTHVQCCKQIDQTLAFEPQSSTPISRKEFLTKKVKDWLFRTTALLARDDDVFFVSTCLPVCDQLRLYFRLGQIPQSWRLIPPVQVRADVDQRDWRLEGKCCFDFELCARFLIPQQIPSLYLEGYTKLVEQVQRLPWPANPKLIWTSNRHEADDVFKAWTAERVEQGCPLVIGQHGGQYGVALWIYVEEHETAICDRFMSWGWSAPQDSKVKPVGQLKAKRALGVKHADQQDALLVTATLPRQSYHMYSTLVASQWLYYFEDQISFVTELPERIQRALRVRLFPHDYGWDQVQRWRDRFPFLRLDEGNSNMDDLIRQSRLCISTYNATTYLESFTMNVPSVIYWNPKHWELRESAVPYFEILKQAGIFHDSPQSAARQVTAIWDAVDEWWGSDDVQLAKQQFCQRYSHLPDDLLDGVEDTLREVIHESRGSERMRSCR